MPHVHRLQHVLNVTAVGLDAVDGLSHEVFQAVVAGPDGQPAVQKLLLRTRKGEGAALHKQLEALAQAQAT